MKEYLNRVRACGPLIHNITNYVTANDVANMLLACGASPIMADEAQEVAEITALSAGLNINMGTPSHRTIPAMRIAGKRANELKHPVLLDPVGVGASAFRRDTVYQLLQEIHFDVIRGNISEIKTIAGLTAGNAGVDAAKKDEVSEAELESVVAFAKKFAAEWNCIIAITGELDFVADVKNCYVIRNGIPQMSQITGTGCQLSGLMTAFLSANPEAKLEAAVAAVCTMGLAGEIAVQNLKSEEGNATFRNRLIDAVYHMTGEMLEGGARYELQ